MKCLHCGGELQSTRGTHRYTESGLSTVTLANVEIRTCTRCGEREVVIPKVARLHQLIARALIRQPGILQPESVRFLRKWLGLSSAGFAQLMGVRSETVSRWENKSGGYPLTPTTDRLLRLLVANHEPVEQYPIDLFKLQPKAKPARIKLRAPDWKEEAA